MSNSNSETDKAWCYYKRVDKALNGLFEILTMNFDENEMFYQCGLDNLEQLKHAIMDLCTHDYNPAEIKRKIRELEFDMKKCLLFPHDKNEGNKLKEKRMMP